MTIEEAHRTGIGGSQMGDVLSLPGCGSALDVWLAIKGHQRRPMNDEDLGRGHGLEAYVFDRYRQHHAPWHRVYRGGDTLRHAEAPHVIGHPDGDVYTICHDIDLMLRCRSTTCHHRVGGLEIKTRSAFASEYGAYGNEGTDDVPPRVIAQCQTYMAIIRSLGAPVQWWDVAVLSGWDFAVHTYRVPFRQAWADAIVTAAERLWWHVKHDIPPDGPADARGFQMDLEPVEIGGRVVIKEDDPGRSVTDALIEAKREKDEATSRYDEATADVRTMMGPHEQLKAPGVTVSWRGKNGRRTFRPTFKKE